MSILPFVLLVLFNIAFAVYCRSSYLKYMGDDDATT